MTQHSLLFHIVRGALVGFAGGLALGLALIFVIGAAGAAARTADGAQRLAASPPVLAGPQL